MKKEIEAERIKIVEYLKNALQYFRKASHSFVMADQLAKSQEMDGKAFAAENQLKTASVPKKEEHLATFITDQNGKLRQTK